MSESDSEDDDDSSSSRRHGKRRKHRKKKKSSRRYDSDATEFAENIETMAVEAVKEVENNKKAFEEYVKKKEERKLEKKKEREGLDRKQVQEETPLDQKGHNSKDLDSGDETGEDGGAALEFLQRMLVDRTQANGPPRATKTQKHNDKPPVSPQTPPPTSDTESGKEKGHENEKRLDDLSPVLTPKRKSSRERKKKARSKFAEASPGRRTKKSAVVDSPQRKQKKKKKKKSGVSKSPKPKREKNSSSPTTPRRDKDELAAPLTPKRIIPMSAMVHYESDSDDSSEQEKAPVTPKRGRRPIRRGRKKESEIKQDPEKVVLISAMVHESSDSDLSIPTDSDISVEEPESKPDSSALSPGAAPWWMENSEHGTPASRSPISPKKGRAN